MFVVALENVLLNIINISVSLLLCRGLVSEFLLLSASGSGVKDHVIHTLENARRRIVQQLQQQLQQQQQQQRQRQNEERQRQQ